MFPEPILWALFFVVFFFVVDLLQYIVPAMMLRKWMLRQERELWAEKQTIEGDYAMPVWMDRPAFVMWRALRPES